ncbi:MAG TPA: biopolymer transporter ExbD [Chromatiales bacterium]|nr:biopolymer transporter ExbD [Chromatiales bacterium]HEX22729.1 biopolymer transporter ExbD [Chromatiales bacterium]
MNIGSDRKEELDVNITPLIDVVFLLLIFFMVSTTFERESEIEIVLPQAAANVVPADDFALEVTVDAEGTFYVNGKRVINSKIETLKKAMQEVAGDRKDPPIILSADAQTPHQAVITVMDAARQLGFVHLNFATVKSNEE